MSEKDEIAALKKEVEALKGALSGKEDKPPPKSTFVPMSDAEHFDRVHQMRERQANTWMPPDAVQAMVAAEPKGFMRDVAMRDNRAPQTAAMIPTQPSNRSDVREPLRGYSAPLSNPPGTGPGSLSDRIADEFDRRDRAELARKLGKG